MVEETKVTGVSVPFLARVLHPIANRLLFAGGLARPHTDRGRGLVTAKEGRLAGHHILAGQCAFSRNFRADYHFYSFTFTSLFCTIFFTLLFHCGSSKRFGL